MTEKTLSGRYRLDDKIGAGGMATVYSGLDTVLRRRVAIKVLRPQFAADEDFVKRFNLEAQHAAKLSHPNVVNIYDVGHEGETYYIVMELVDGTTLGDMIRADGTIPERVAIDYATQICAGLAYAHRQGLLHRDIKPANILITKDDVVKLSDFGIARAVTTQTVTVTQPGMVMGSVFYLSPEQAQGHELAATSDLYSLGIVLYQMLTGELPYTGESPVTVALKHVSAPIPPVNLDGNERVSPALAAIIRKLMQKDPGARFASATEVAAALREARERPADAAAFESPDSHAPDEAAAAAAIRRAMPNPKPRPSRFPDRRGPERDERDDRGDAERRGDDRSRRVTPPPDDMYARGARPRPPASPRLGRAAYDSAGEGYARNRAEADYGGYGDDEEPAARGPWGLPPWASPQRLAIAAALVIAALIGYAAFSRTGEPGGTQSSSIFGGVFGPPRPVVVPNVVGKTIGDARAALAQANLGAKVVTVPSEVVPKDRVVKQVPAPSAKIPGKSEIELDVSSGMPVVSLLDLRQYSADDASRYLRTAKLLYKVNTVYSDSIPKGTVIAQQPGPNAQVPMHSNVTLTVSGGPKPATVPFFVSKKLSDAGALAAKAHVRIAVTERVQSDTIPADVIASQNPAPGTQVDPNTTISVTVSSGAPQAAMPNLEGRNVADAQSAAQAAGLSTRINYVVDQSMLPGTVMQQDPAAGAQIRKGAPVTLSVAVPGKVPDVSGTPVDQAKTALQNAGYVPGGVIFEPSGEPGRVLRSDPPAGSDLRPGATVNLHVGGQQ